MARHKKKMMKKVAAVNDTAVVVPLCDESVASMSDQRLFVYESAKRVFHFLVMQLGLWDIPEEEEDEEEGGKEGKEGREGREGKEGLSGDQTSSSSSFSSSRVQIAPFTVELRV